MASPLNGKLDLDKSIKRENSWLEQGTYQDVTILDVDPTEYVRNGRLQFTFDKNKRTHREGVFLLNQTNNGISWKLAAIIAACFPGPEVTEYYQWLTEDDWEDALQAMRGMKLTVRIHQGPGYIIEFDSETQTYKAIEKSEVVCEHTQLESLERICKARNLSKSYRSANEFESGEEHITKRNLLALRTALESRQRSQASEEDSPSPKTARFIRTTPRK